MTKSEAMARVRTEGTEPELLVRRGLWRAGVRYRVNLRIEGVRADIVFPRHRVAVFIDGCFWHACPVHGSTPSTNSGFWIEKLRSNADRDHRQTRTLTEAGWRVMRFWEHQVVECLPDVLSAITLVLTEGDDVDRRTPESQRRLS